MKHQTRNREVVLLVWSLEENTPYACYAENPKCEGAVRTMAEAIAQVSYLCQDEECWHLHYGYVSMDDLIDAARGRENGPGLSLESSVALVRWYPSGSIEWNEPAITELLSSTERAKLNDKLLRAIRARESEYIA